MSASCGTLTVVAEDDTDDGTDGGNGDTGNGDTGNGDEPTEPSGGPSRRQLAAGAGLVGVGLLALRSRDSNN